MNRKSIRVFLKSRGFKFDYEKNWENNPYAENSVYFRRGNLWACIVYPQIFFYGSDNVIIEQENIFTNEDKFIEMFNENFN